MRNIPAYKNDSFKFHETVVARKRKTEVKDAASKYEAHLKNAFSEYDKKFGSNSLAELTPLVIPESDHEYLLELYSYSAKSFVELKAALTTIDGKIFNICPLCTVDPIESFDHIVPKDEFVEFVDHPKNLIPCCSSCNSKKNAVWRKGNKAIFLNLYLDPLPESEYLSVDTVWTDDVPSLVYAVTKPDDINDEIFGKIQLHYSRLNLCNRFSLQSTDTIGEINAEIRAYRKLLDDSQIRTCIYEKGINLKEEYGNNYWKALLFQQCGENTKLYEYIRDRK